MFSEQTYEIIKQRILDNINKDIDKREGSFTNNMISPIAVELAQAYIGLGDILNLLFVTDSYGEYLDKKASEFGVYRKSGIKAKGIVRIYGPDDTVIPRNATLTTENGLTFVVYRQDYIKKDYVDITVEASNIGEMYNIDKNSTWKFTITDGENIIEAYNIENNSNITGGLEIETDEQLRERILEQARNPATTGNEQDYINWCKEVDGVFNATVRPCWNGPNTVKLIISDEDKQPLPQSVVEKCNEHIQNIRPILADVTVINPSIFNVDISLTIYTTSNTDNIKEQIKNVTVEHLKKCNEKIRLNALGAEYLNIDGVVDYDLLSVNGLINTVIDIPVDSVAMLRNLTVNFNTNFRRR